MTAQNRPGLGWRPRRNAKSFGPMVAAVAFALVVAACSSAAGEAPSFTYAPVPSTSTMPGMDVSPPASAPATSAAPAGSEPASAAPGSAASSAPTAAALHISARNIEFDTDHLEAPAGQAFVLEFDNNDPGIPHNVEITNASGASMFKGQIIMGPAKASYQVPALAAGNYSFVCDVHPTMTGTLTVK